MLPWLAAVCVFVSLSALYLGGFPLRIEGGGGVRQLGGWVLSGALFLAVWRGLWAVTAGLLPQPAAVAVAALLTAALLPLLTWAAFRALGVRISRGAPAVH